MVWFSSATVVWFYSALDKLLHGLFLQQTERLAKGEAVTRLDGDVHVVSIFEDASNTATANRQPWM